MEASRRLGEIVRGLLAVYEPANAEEARLIERFNALPVAETWFGYLLVDRDGTVFDLDCWEEPPGVRVLDGLRGLIAATSYGSRRFAELEPLVPQRPAQSPDCVPCGGDGVVDKEKGTRCAMCAGLGWLPDDA